MFLESISYNLANLTNFAGRDSRSTFWWYVLFLVIVQFGIGILSSIPLMVGTVGSAMDAVQSGADEAQMQAQMMADMADMIGTTAWISAITSVVITLLLIAAFVRRLHDGGFSELWAAIPLMTKAAAIYFSITMIAPTKELLLNAGAGADVDQLTAELSRNPLNYISWIGFIAVIVFGLMQSQPEANRYGDVPKAPGH